MQLLSTVDTNKAVSQVATIRQRTTAELPPEVPPAEVPKSQPSMTSIDSFTGPATTSASEHRKGSIKAAAVSGSASEGNSLYGIGAEDLKKYGLIALCLLGANLLIGLVLLVIFVFNWVRRGSAFGGGKGGRARFLGVSSPYYAPVKSQELDGSDSASYYPTRYGD